MKDPQSGNELSQSQESDVAAYGSGERRGKKYISGPAQMGDEPGIPVEVKDEAEMYFESSAMPVEGTQKGIYYGAIRWEWRKKAGVKQPDKIELALVSEDVPDGPDFQKLGSLWDAIKSRRKPTGRLGSTMPQPPPVTMRFFLIPASRSPLGQPRTLLINAPTLGSRPSAILTAPPMRFSRQT
jgi:hypothetical protein